MLCHSERSDESENINWRFFSLRSTTRQIFCDAQDDIMIGEDYFNTPSRINSTCEI